MITWMMDGHLWLAASSVSIRFRKRGGSLLVLTADWMFENTHFEMWRCWGRRNLTTSVRPPLISTRWRIRWLKFLPEQKDNDDNKDKSDNVDVQISRARQRWPAWAFLLAFKRERGLDLEGGQLTYIIYINRSTGLPKNYPSGNSQEQIQMIFLDHFGPLISQ